MKKKNIVSKNGLLLTQQEMVLIKNSFEASDTIIYGNLFDCIKEYKKMSRRDLDQNIAFDKSARAVLLNYENKKHLMDKILKEWYSAREFDISEEKMNCQLCGHSNTYIFYIHNRITNVDLHIGSDCVKNFSDITGLYQEKRRLSRIVKEAERQKRKIEFESYLQDKEDTDFLETVKTKLDGFNIMLPFELYKNIQHTLECINLVKSSYINSGGDVKEAIEKYFLLKREFNLLFNKAGEHCLHNKNNKFICDKKTAEWLYRNNMPVWEKVGLNNAVLNKDTLQKIYCENFMLTHLSEFRKCLNDPEIKISRIQGNNIYFSFNSKKSFRTIAFIVSSKYFMENIGANCLCDISYNYSRIEIDDIIIENSKNNFEAVYSLYSTVFKRNGYDFIIEDKTEQAYWVKLPCSKVKSRWSNNIHQTGALYKKSSILVLLRVLAPYILKDVGILEENFKSITSKMESGQAWITQQEKNTIEEIAKEARGLQKQREFIPY